MDPLFEATVQATEEAILNALCAARTVTGYQDHTAYALTDPPAAATPTTLSLVAMPRRNHANSVLQQSIESLGRVLVWRPGIPLHRLA